MKTLKCILIFLFYKNFYGDNKVTTTFFVGVRQGKMSNNVEQCRTTSNNVEQCRIMSYNVEQCRTMSKNVEKCRSNLFGDLILCLEVLSYIIGIF